MTIDSGLACVLLGVVVAIQGWILTEVVRLKVKVAVLAAKLQSNDE